MSISSMTGGGKVKLKIVLLGDQHVGKSSMIDRFVNNKFQQGYNATIGIDFLVKNMVYQNKTYRMQLWDTAGQQRFKALIPSYMKDSHCGLIIYDLSKPKTFENTQMWLQFYKEHMQTHSVVLLVGNKTDLSQQQKKCDINKIEVLSKKLKINHYEVSAKTGQGIQQLFQNIIIQTNNAQKKQTFELIPQNKQDQQHENTRAQALGKAPIQLNNHIEQYNDKNSKNKQSCC